jgi:outer membrane immunogenic protein
VRTLSAFLALALTSGSALAVDFLEPVVPTEPGVIGDEFSWTGFYAGLNAGWGFGGNEKFRFQHQPNYCNSFFCDEADRNFEHVNDNFELNGLLAGAHAGARYQTGNFVLGIEGEFKWSGISDDNGGGPGDDSDCDFAANEGFSRELGIDLHASFDCGHVDIDWFGTVDLQAGVAVERALFYILGGFAGGGVDYNVGFRDIRDYAFETEVDAGSSVPVPGVVRGRRILEGEVEHNDTEWGYTLGGGIDFAITDTITIGLQYKYLNLGAFGDDNGSDDGDGEIAVHIREQTFTGDPLTPFGKVRKFDERGRGGLSDEPTVDFHTLHARVSFKF